MVEKEFVVQSDAGIHARPASMLVKLAMGFPCEVFIEKDGVEANAKSIMGVLSLAITQGSKLIIRAVGEKEEEACTQLLELFKSDFK
ncbi:MAG: HPr family phosphocarrier protein [Spirochaetes bacterium]|nr:HPr family phosphocarrier protein [Spirochaetota bacterium]